MLGKQLTVPSSSLQLSSKENNYKNIFKKHIQNTLDQKSLVKACFSKKNSFKIEYFFQCAVTLKIVFKKGMTITNKFQTLQIPGWGMRSFAQNCSYYCSCSLKKSNHEQIALVALNKRATMSDLLRSLMTKEQP